MSDATSRRLPLLAIAAGILAFASFWFAVSLQLVCTPGRLAWETRCGVFGLAALGVAVAALWRARGFGYGWGLLVLAGGAYFYGMYWLRLTGSDFDPQLYDSAIFQVS